MKLLYGTTNEAKLHSMQKAVKPLGIELIGLRELQCDLPKIVESGASPLENAQMKACAYYEAFGMPVFSCDSGLYFDGLAEGEQPGIHVRRVRGRVLDDEEMIAHYASLAALHGGSLIGRYRNAICLVRSESEIYSSMDITLATEPFLLVERPHSKRVAGFPLDSLSKDLKSGAYYYDLNEKEVTTTMEEGFRAFFAQFQW